MGHIHRIVPPSSWWYCVLPSQLTLYSKAHIPTINVWQVVSAFVVGYVHPHLVPHITEIQYTFQPMCGWWINWLALLHNPLHLHLRDHEIDLSDKVQCLPYARMTASSVDGHLVGVEIVYWCSTNMLLGHSCFFDEIKPSLWHSCQIIHSVMLGRHQGYVHLQPLLFNQLCKPAEPSDKHFTCLLSMYPGLSRKGVQYCCF